MDFDDLEFEQRKPKPIAIDKPSTRNQKPYKRPKGDRERVTSRVPMDQNRPRSGKPAIKTGGVVFIGPIPIIWGSDRKIAFVMAIVSVVLVVIFLIFALSLFM
jgi:uncharacterized protein (TIGR00304 family)